MRPQVLVLSQCARSDRVSCLLSMLFVRHFPTVTWNLLLWVLINCFKFEYERSLLFSKDPFPYHPWDWYFYLHEWLTKMVHVYINIHQSHIILWDWMWESQVFAGMTVWSLVANLSSGFLLEHLRWQSAAPVRSVDPMGDPGSSMDRKTLKYNLNIECCNCEYFQYSKWCVSFFFCNVGFSRGESPLLWTTRYFLRGCDLLHYDFVVVILLELGQHCVV